MNLYHDLILDHYRNPRNFGTLVSPTHHGEAKNPLCGDRLQMDIRAKDGKIDDVRFEGSGCAISQASASILTEKVKGLRIEEAKQLSPSDVFKLIGVTLSPARIKCGLLSLETLKTTIMNHE